MHWIGKKKISLLSFLVVAVIVCAISGKASEKAAPRWVVADRAIDGDTFRLKDGRSVRLIGIDSPEIDHRKGEAEAWAVDSWRALGRLVDGRRVRLAFGATLKDSHDRVLAYVFDEAGASINQDMVEQGLAYVLYVAPNIAAHEQLLSSQLKAMDAKKGIWQTNASENGPVLGNRHSKRFHQSRCQLAAKMHPNNKVYFNNRLDAFRKGYAPCKQCNSLPKKKLKHP